MRVEKRCPSHVCTSDGASASPGFSHRLTLKTLTLALLASICWLMPQRSLAALKSAFDSNILMSFL